MNRNEQRKVIPAPVKVSRWLELAKSSPSGGNAQPWRVEYEENDNQVAFRLTIDSDYKAHSSIMDVKGVASALALGSLAESLILTAENDSFGLVGNIIETGEDIWHGGVQLLFEKRTTNLSIAKSPLLNIKALLQRHTHRGVYNKKKLPEIFTQNLTAMLDDFKNLKYKILEPGNQLLFHSLATLEKIRWQHRPYLESLLSEISFDVNEKSRALKIPSTQLGVSLPDQLLLKTMKRFPRFGAFVMNLGFSSIPVMKSTSRFVKNCQKIVFLQAPENNFSSCYSLGRCIQQIWISSAAANVMFQPNGNALIALGHWLAPENSNLTDPFIARVQDATNVFEKNFNLDLKKPVLGFRLGFSDELVERSPRKNIQGISRHDLIRKIQKEL